MGRKRRSRAFKESNQIIDFEEERQKRKEKRKQSSGKKRERKEPDTPGSSRRAAKRVRRRLFYMAVVVLVIGMVSFSVYNVVTLRIERAEAEAQKTELEKEKKKLEKEFSLVNSDEYIEEKAREELHMTMPGELIYVLPPEQSTDAAIEPTNGALQSTNGAIQVVDAPADEDKNVLDKIVDGIKELGDNLKTLVRK